MPLDRQKSFRLVTQGLTNPLHGLLVIIACATLECSLVWKGSHFQLPPPGQGFQAGPGALRGAAAALVIAAAVAAPAGPQIRPGGIPWLARPGPQNPPEFPAHAVASLWPPSPAWTAPKTTPLCTENTCDHHCDPD